MNYIENTYICLAAPLLLAILLLRRDGRRALLFLTAGMTACLLSAYVSSFTAGAIGMDLAMASHEISPVVEEIMKSFPLLFYILIFEPRKEHAISATLLTAVGFATFENVCFLTAYGTKDLPRLLIRGFGTGAMHVMCGMAVSVGLYFLWEKIWLRAVGGFALLCFVITYHALFNILVNQTGAAFWIGSAVPLTMMLGYFLFLRKRIILS